MAIIVGGFLFFLLLTYIGQKLLLSVGEDDENQIKENSENQLHNCENGGEGGKCEGVGGKCEDNPAFNCVHI